MTGEDEGANADEHDKGGDDDAVLVGSKHLAAIGILVLATFGDEDGVVVALSEDEGGENDVYHIELDAQQGHNAQYPHPAYSHREEGKHGELDGTH